MLSIVILTAIAVVALTQLRITTLSILRSITLAFALGLLLCMSIGTSNHTLFNGAIVSDMLTGYTTLLLIALLVVVIAYNSNPITTGAGTPYTSSVFVVIIVIGAYYLLSCNDLLTFMIALEVQSFALYSLTALYRYREGATSAGLMYFMLGAFSSALAFLGLAIVYAYTGETRFDILYGILAYTTGHNGIATIGVILLLSGILFKTTAAPFHHWGPEVYDRVPTITTLFISIMPKVALTAFMIRLSSVIDPIGINGILIYTALLSWGFGGIIGVVQTRIKRLLAYSTVNHVGWILVSIAIGSTMGYGATLFYIMQYSMTTCLSFLTLITLGYTLYSHSDQGSSNKNDVEVITSLSGLSSHSFILALIMAITLFSAAGIPPLIGFYGKLSVIQALLYENHVIVVFTGIVFSVVSAGYYLNVIATMVFKPLSSS